MSDDILRRADADWDKYRQMVLNEMVEGDTPLHKHEENPPYLCPKCGSSNFDEEANLPGYFTCQDCHAVYPAFVIENVRKDAKKRINDIKKSPSEKMHKKQDEFVEFFNKGFEAIQDFAKDHIDPAWDFDNADQDAKADAGKPQLTLVPRQIIWDIAEVREYGNKKYPKGGPDNWKTVRHAKKRYRDALMRHLMAYLDDPKSVDEESGIPHYKHMACNMAFLAELEAGNVPNQEE